MINQYPYRITSHHVAEVSRPIILRLMVIVSKKLPRSRYFLFIVKNYVIKTWLKNPNQVFCPSLWRFQTPMMGGHDLFYIVFYIGNLVLENDFVPIKLNGGSGLHLRPNLLQILCRRIPLTEHHTVGTDRGPMILLSKAMPTQAYQYNNNQLFQSQLVFGNKKTLS